MGKSCWIASLAIQQLFPIQIFLTFPIFKLLPNFIFQCYRPQTWQFYLVFLLFTFLVLTESQVLNLMVGRSYDQVLQSAYCRNIHFNFSLLNWLLLCLFCLFCNCWVKVFLLMQCYRHHCAAMFLLCVRLLSITKIPEHIVGNIPSSGNFIMRLV